MMRGQWGSGWNDYATQMMGQNGLVSTYANTNFPSWFGKFMLILPVLLVVFIIWSLFWKGWALWKSARAGNKVWFFVLLVVNTLGILEILYIFWFSKKDDTQPVK